MSQMAMKLMEKILILPIDERIILAQRVWDSVEDFVNPEVENAWLDEAEKRWQEIEQRKVQCISAEKVMKKARISLKK